MPDDPDLIGQNEIEDMLQDGAAAKDTEAVEQWQLRTEIARVIENNGALCALPRSSFLIKYGHNRKKVGRVMDFQPQGNKILATLHKHERIADSTSFRPLTKEAPNETGDIMDVQQIPDVDYVDLSTHGWEYVYPHKAINGPQPSAATDDLGYDGVIVTDDMHVMRHLNRPQWHVGATRSPEFLALMEAVAQPDVLALLREMFSAEPLFRSISLFVNPTRTSEAGKWHRDCQFLLPEEADERRALEQLASSQLVHARGCQMQVALCKNDDVELVRGSHLRWDRPEEYQVRCADGRSHSREPMPGATRIALEPGDAVCFNSWG